MPDFLSWNVSRHRRHVREKPSDVDEAIRIRSSVNEHQKIHHVVLSPPLGWYDDLAKAGNSMAQAQ